MRPRWAIATCERTPYISRVFGAELKPVLPFFVTAVFPPDIWGGGGGAGGRKSVSLPQKFAFSWTIPMPEFWRTCSVTMPEFWRTCGVTSCRQWLEEGHCKPRLGVWWRNPCWTVQIDVTSFHLFGIRIVLHTNQCMSSLRRLSPPEMHFVFCMSFTFEVSLVWGCRFFFG